jgi:hypothetical protein
MLIIHPDGHCEETSYADYRSIGKGVNLPGGDDPFTMVPLPERDQAGYTVYANDVGLLIGMAPNPWAERLCMYDPLVGPIVVTSFEESKEDDLIGSIVPEVRKQFLVRLTQVREAATAFYATRMN